MELIGQILGYDGQLMLVKVRFKKGQWEVCMNIFILSRTMVVSGQFELL